MLDALLSLVEDGRIDPGLLPTLRVHLDWIQYRANFREPITLRRAADTRGEAVPLTEVAVDLRQVETAHLRRGARTGPRHPRAFPGRRWPPPARRFRPVRDSVIWQFNRLFWQRLGEWERPQARLRGGVAERALGCQSPAGRRRLGRRLLDAPPRHGQARPAPPEIFALEIGVGSGARAAALARSVQGPRRECGTGYYSRLRFLLGDYSLPTLDRALAAVRATRTT